MTKNDFLHDAFITWPKLYQNFLNTGNTKEFEEKLQLYANLYEENGFSYQYMQKIILGNILSTKGKILLANENFDPVSELILPIGINVIDEELFKNSKETSIVLPDGLVYIGKSAFSGSENLKRITLPTSLKIIDMSAFSGCLNLEDIIIPKHTQIESFVFKDTKYELNVMNGIIDCQDNVFESFNNDAQIKTSTGSKQNINKYSDFIFNAIQEDLHAFIKHIIDDIDRIKNLIDFSVQHNMFDTFIENILNETERESNYENVLEILTYLKEQNYQYNEFEL